jgi:hypothetical protein
MTKEIPEWAKQRACDLANAGGNANWTFWTLDEVGVFGSLAAFARYIAEKEQPPVDPLLLEAREILAQYYDRQKMLGVAQGYREGLNDKGLVDSHCYRALKRGIEIGKEQASRAG